jgi:Xaa-Pro aminopeptidase
MARVGLDALFISEPKNYMYFTGHRSDQIVGDKIRPFIVVLPANGEPICFGPPFELGHIRLTTWIKNVSTYQLLRHNEVIAATLREAGLDNARIGSELGREQYLGMNLLDFRALEQLLPDAKFVDASDVLLSLRVIKSPRELERLRNANSITSSAIAQAFDQVKPGMSTIDVARLVRIGMMERGADGVAAMMIAAGHDFTNGKVSVPTPRPLEVGDTLTVDCSASVKGYYSDIARTAVIGMATDEQKSMYRMVVDLNHKCYEELRPGNLCEDVNIRCQNELQKLGRQTQAVGRIGHGVGCDPAEYPSLAMGEKLPLEAGMVFACNPNFTTDFGFFNVEENLVVTENGAKMLVDPEAPAELRVLG